MRKLLWMVFLFGVYMWVMTSGRDRLLFEHGKALYRAFIAWFDDADVDFQSTNRSKSKKDKKRQRRWD